MRGLPEFRGELPIATLADEIETDDRAVRALVTVAGNPVLSAPNGRPPRARLWRARAHRRNRLLPERDDPAGGRHPATAVAARTRALRPRAAMPSRSGMWRSIQTRLFPARNPSGTTGRLSPRSRRASSFRAGCAVSRRLAPDGFALNGWSMPCCASARIGCQLPG